MCVRVCVRARVCVGAYVCVHACVCVCVCVCVHVHACVHVWKVLGNNTHIDLAEYIHVYVDLHWMYCYLVF